MPSVHQHLRPAEQRLKHIPSVVAQVVLDLVRRIRELTATITDTKPSWKAD